jgi:hypothetical protein
MLFELKISTDNAAEFSSFGAEFSRFIEAWNAKQAKPVAAPNVDAAQLPATDPELLAKINAAREIPGVKSNTEMVSQPSLSDREGVANVPETVTPPKVPAVSGTDEKPKRHRRTKAEIEAARAAEQGGVLSKDTPIAVSESDATIDDVKAAYNAMCKALGPKSRGVSAEMLLELGVAKFSELKPEQFAIAIDKMQRKASQNTKTAERIDDEIAF